jgi:hypothetical protein
MQSALSVAYHIDRHRVVRLCLPDPPFAAPTLTLFLIALVAVVVLPALFAIWWTWRSRSPRGASRNADSLDTLVAWPPSATRVLAQGERDAYELLRAALPAHMVLAQVPLHRFIKVPTRNSYSEWMRRVGRQHADLLVCDHHSQVLAAIEVIRDDDAPGGRAQQRRDRMIRVLSAAQIPVHIWRASALPSADEAREAILPGATASDFQPTSGHVQARGFGANPVLPDSLEDAIEEPVGLREPPPSTWFDDLDSASAPLGKAEHQSLDPRVRSPR